MQAQVLAATLDVVGLNLEQTEVKLEFELVGGTRAVATFENDETTDSLPLFLHKLGAVTEARHYEDLTGRCVRLVLRPATADRPPHVVAILHAIDSSRRLVIDKADEGRIGDLLSRPPSRTLEK